MDAKELINTVRTLADQELMPDEIPEAVKSRHPGIADMTCLDLLKVIGSMKVGDLLEELRKK